MTPNSLLNPPSRPSSPPERPGPGAGADRATTRAAVPAAPTFGVDAATDASVVRPGPFDGWVKRAVLGRLAGLRHGEVVFRDETVSPPHEARVGRPGADFPRPVLVRVRSPRFWRAVGTGGSIGAGESFMAREWECDDLVGLVRILVRNREVLEGMEGGLARLAAPARRLWHRLRDNTRSGSRRNIAEHYDLGNDFYALWLDETLTYSCALFEHPGQDLADAQRAKIDALLVALDLRPGERLLEIGTGWGALAERAATRFGAKVTTTTISQAQHDFARERFARAGLDGKRSEGAPGSVELLLADYRDLRGSYDKVVSVEMVEAVGWRHFEDYFGAISGRLAPAGRAALQAILIQDRYYEAARREVDFIQRHVFPGSCIPSTAALLEASRRATDLRLADFRDLTPHYVSTLAEWRRRFLARADEVRAQGFPERFLRLWEFYLAYCEGGFAERQIGVAQLVFDKPLARGGLVRGGLLRGGLLRGGLDRGGLDRGGSERAGAARDNGPSRVV